MIVFRWIMGVLGGVFAVSWVIVFALYILNGDDRFGELSTRIRRWLTIVVLFWFNIEVWGRVVWTIITW
jgi:threonine/homoserine/homoserine lactone efflux protein